MPEIISQDTSTRRRSDRVALELPIEVVGTDSHHGRDFMEKARTLVVSRYGATILLQRKLVPEQGLTICCSSSRKEAPARVVGQIGREEGGYTYGVAFLDEAINVWDIEFPPLSESEKAVARALLACMRCRSLEVVYLNDIEAEIFESTHRLSRPCKRCGESGFWTMASDKSAEPPIVDAAVASSPGPGARVQMKACVRHPHFGDDIVLAENISRTGLSFKSSKHYDGQLPLQVAVPYLPGSGNIFAPIQIDHCGHLPSEKLTRYAVSYILVHRG